MKRKQRTPRTCYRVDAQQVVAYPLKRSETKSVHVTFNTRHNLGHTIVDYLTRQGIDPNDLCSNDKPNKKLRDAIKKLATQLAGKKKSRKAGELHVKISQNETRTESVKGKGSGIYQSDNSLMVD